MVMIGANKNNAFRICFGNDSMNMLDDVDLSSLNRNEARAKRLWQNADAVCFDVDSTLCTDEMIDEFAKYLHCYEVIKFTEGAMNGAISFRESLKIRLSILKPTRKQLEEFIRERKPKLTPGSKALITKLQSCLIPIYLISGSFLSMILPVAKILKVDEANIYANELFFDENGKYIGFDETKLTSDSGCENFGKAAVCKKLKMENGYQNLVMIGDGMTDLEASLQADLFIGFGGNRCREIVKKKAPWFVYNFDTLRRSLKK